MSGNWSAVRNMSENNHQRQASSSNYSIASILNLSQISQNIPSINEHNSLKSGFQQKGVVNPSKDVPSFQGSDTSKKKENANGKAWSSIITQLLS